MASLPPEDLRPVLVADLADDESLEVLEGAARTGSPVYVPLESAPVDTSVHLLEVHVPSTSTAFYFEAEPLGPEAEDGFPLRVRPLDQHPVVAKERAPSGSGVVRGRGRSTTKHALSQSHTNDLSHVGPLPKDPDEEAGALVGRALANGKLIIESVIGRGGVGAVYRAMHRELRIPVAVKVLHESFQKDLEFCRRFYAEALAASRLDHPNITRVIDFGQEPDGVLYFAMEFLAGEELRAVLERRRRLDTKRIVDLAVQVCAGLSHAHARGIVHRDIKPENLVIVRGFDDDGEPVETVKVCDFGIAQHRAAEGLVPGNVIAGTPEYMSPEQCRGEALDARSDVYAVGIVLYEALTGQLPFVADTPGAILEKQKNTPPLPPSTVTPGVDPMMERVILRCLAKDRDARYSTMRELRAALREVLADDSPGPPSVASLRTNTLELVVPPGNAGASPVPAAAKPAPAWLERNSMAGMPAVQVPTGLGQAPTGLGKMSGTLQLDAGVSAASATLVAQLGKTVDPAAFGALAARLEPVIRAAAQRGEVTTLWSLSRTLGTIAVEGMQSPGSRASHAAKLLRAFEDPGVLASVADQALEASGEARDAARRLLVHAGVAGAHGLYGARVKRAADAKSRGPFVAILKDFGPRAWPVVRAALEKIVTHETNFRAMELAEDLLLAVPAVGDEAAGHLVVKYLRVPVAGPCRAATASIVKLWGERAKPLLVGMVQAKHDVVRIAGIAGLKQLGGIDEHVVPRLHAILARRVPATDELRTAAAMALGSAASSAHKPAVSALTQVLAGNDPPVVLAAAARSLLAIGGPAYRGPLTQLAERSQEPLRGALRTLLSDPR